MAFEVYYEYHFLQEFLPGVLLWTEVLPLLSSPPGSERWGLHLPPIPEILCLLATRTPKIPMTILMPTFKSCLKTCGAGVRGGRGGPSSSSSPVVLVSVSRPGVSTSSMSQTYIKRVGFKGKQGCKISDNLLLKSIVCCNCITLNIILTHLAGLGIGSGHQSGRGQPLPTRREHGRGGEVRRREQRGSRWSQRSRWVRVLSPEAARAHRLSPWPADSALDTIAARHRGPFPPWGEQVDQPVPGFAPLSSCFSNCGETSRRGNFRGASPISIIQLPHQPPLLSTE